MHALSPGLVMRCSSSLPWGSSNWLLAAPLVPTKAAHAGQQRAGRSRVCGMHARPPPPRRAEAPRPNVLVTLLGSLFLRHAAAMVAEEEEEEQQQRGKQRGR